MKMNSGGAYDTLQPMDKWDTAMVLCLLRQELDLCDAYIPTGWITAVELGLIRKSIVTEMKQLEVTLNVKPNTLRRH